MKLLNQLVFLKETEASEKLDSIETIQKREQEKFQIFERNIKIAQRRRQALI